MQTSNRGLILAFCSSKLANVITLALGVRTRVTGYHHFKSAKDLGAVSPAPDVTIVDYLHISSGYNLTHQTH